MVYCAVFSCVLLYLHAFHCLRLVFFIWINTNCGSILEVWLRGDLECMVSMGFLLCLVMSQYVQFPCSKMPENNFWTCETQCWSLDFFSLFTLRTFVKNSLLQESCFLNLRFVCWIFFFLLWLIFLINSWILIILFYLTYFGWPGYWLWKSICRNAAKYLWMMMIMKDT